MIGVTDDLWSDHAAAASSDAPGVQPGEGGSQPTLPLQPSLFDMGRPDWSAPRDDIRFVSPDTARSWFGRFHYSGTPGNEGAWFYGVFRPEMVACVAIGGTSNAHGVAAKYGLEAWPGNLEITRVAVHPDAPRNTTSQVLARIIKRAHVDRHVSWLFSYADTGQGHHGGIYQAIGACYVGMSEARQGYRYNGEPIHPRSVVARWGSQATEFVKTIPGMEIVEGLNTAKHVYIIPVGPDAPAIRAALSSYIRPYPKREAPSGD